MTSINMLSSPAKRKRDESSSPSHPSSTDNDATPRFTFYAPTPLAAAISAADIEDDADGGSSPRTRVASRFGSLVIEERVHKRMRSEADGADGADEAVERSEDTDNTGDAGEDTADVELRGGAEPNTDLSNDDFNDIDTTPRPIFYNTPIDPLRASLTWQDDEITVYDPNDKDDDGTGVNGIGFKPTPAIAHARALKRRQQLAEYRKREEREARAKRSRRRPRVYGSASRARVGQAKTEVEDAPEDEDKTEKEQATTTRRVRFLETGPVTIRFLEPEVVV